MSDTLSATMAASRPPALAFDALYRSTRSDLYAYVRSLVGDAATADDITAQAFERAYRKRRSFDARRGSPRQWLFTIARNTSLDELRRRRRAATPIADPGRVVATAVSGASPDLESAEDDRLDTVRDALASLAPRDRDLVGLKFYAGLTNAEIAATLGTSESNVGTRLHRVLTNLREACA